MDIRQLQYFISVAEHLNFTEAANRLFVAQSAVSHQIALLESNLGVKLFERTKRHVRLTTAGEVFLKEAIKIVYNAQQAIESARLAHAGFVGVLQVGFFLNAPTRKFFPNLIRRHRQLYPKVDLKLFQMNHGQLNAAIEDDTIDIAFTNSFGLQHEFDLNRKKVFTDSSVIALTSEHPLASRSYLNLSELVKEPFIVSDPKVSPQAFERTLQLCGSCGFSPNIVSQTGNVETVLMLVEARVGIAIVPKSLQSLAGDSVCFLPINDVEDSFEIVAVWKDVNPNPSIPLFLEQVDIIISELSLESI